MNDRNTSYVFLLECADFSEARVAKSFLESQGFHPRVRDEQTRSVAPHLGDALGKLIIDIPEHEFLSASQALESIEPESKPAVVADSQETQNLAKKCLWNAILGIFIIPVLCNVYSMILGLRVLGREMPLSTQSKRRLFIAMLINAAAFYFWLMFGFKYFFDSIRGA